MLMLKSQQENPVQTSAAHAVWQLTFRSFFLTGAAVSVFSIIIWLLALMGLMDLSQNPIPSIVWHAHEMIFGFAVALLVGVAVGTYSSMYVAATTLLQLGVSKEDVMVPEREGADQEGLMP